MKIKMCYKILFSAATALLLLAANASAFENLRYEIDCQLSIDKHQISAKEKVIFTNNSDKELKEIFFHIYPHRKFTEAEKEFMMRFAGYFKIDPFPEGFQSGDLKVKKIYENSGSHLSFKIEGEDETILKVMLPQPLMPNQRLEINLDFDVEIPHAFGRFGWHKNIIALTRWYPMLSVLDKDGWHNYPFYPYHQPFFSDAASYKVKLTLPKEQTVIHTGILSRESENNSQNKTLIIETELPVRDFSLATSSDYQLISKTQDNVKINSYYLKGDEFYADKALESSSDLMQNYAKKFGSYPYKEFNIAPVYLGFGGDQSSNLILIDTRVYKLPKFLIRYFDFLISHETGHQWFYNIVGSDEYKEMWLDEGVNSYFILDYLEAKYGKDAFVMELPKPFSWVIPNFSFRRARDRRYIFLAKNGLDRPVLGELSSFQEPSSIFALTYGKGAMVLDMLRSLIDKDAFNRVFQRYFQDFKFKNISVADFVDMVNRETKQNLTWFFDEWLKTDKKCDYAIKEVKKEKIVLENRGSIEMPIKTKIDFHDGSALIDDWDGKERKKDINISNTSGVKKVTLDPDAATLDLDRTNNLWPRVLYIQPVPIYYGVYEYPLFFPDDSYNLAFGPDFSNGAGAKVSLQKPFDDILYLASGYDFNGKKVNSQLGYELKHVLNQEMALGFELFKNIGIKDRTDNLDGGKLYLRKELWPASYGLTEVNDHITFYILRNRRFDGGASISGLEDVENFSYLQSDEAILGTTFFLNRCGPYFAPEAGYRFSATVENAEHFLGGEQYYWREMFDAMFYKTVLKETQLATRIKFGWGNPSDKNLYQLGGNDGLRGFDLKTIRGARTMLGSFEFRFPIKRGLNYGFFDNILGVEELQGVVFFDVGKSWFNDFEAAKFKKDAGLGLRIHFNICSSMEKAVLRLDVAQAIHEPKQQPRFWVGINQAF